VKPVGRKRSTGKYDTFEELNKEVLRLHPRYSTSYIANQCEVAVGTIYNILKGNEEDENSFDSLKRKVLYGTNWSKLNLVSED